MTSLKPIIPEIYTLIVEKLDAIPSNLDPKLINDTREIACQFCDWVGKVECSTEDTIEYQDGFNGSHFQTAVNCKTYYTKFYCPFCMKENEYEYLEAID